MKTNNKTEPTPSTTTPHINTATKAGVAILAATALLTAALLIQFMLGHPKIPWYVWIAGILPPIPNPFHLIAYAAFQHNEWLPATTGFVGSILGGVILFLGLNSKRK